MVGVESNPKLHTLSLRVTAVSNLRLTAENLSQVPSLTRLSFQVTAFNNPTQPIDTSAAPPASPMPMTGDNMSEGSGSPRIPVMFGGTQRQRLDDMRRIALAQAAVRAHESPLRALPVPMRATRDDAATTADQPVPVRFPVAVPMDHDHNERLRREQQRDREHEFAQRHLRHPHPHHHHPHRGDDDDDDDDDSDDFDDSDEEFTDSEDDDLMEAEATTAAGGSRQPQPPAAPTPPRRVLGQPASDDEDDSEDEDDLDDDEHVELAKSPVCMEPHYRAFIITAMPNLQRLDGYLITQQERDAAPDKISQHTEKYAYGFGHRPLMFRSLREREAGVRSVTSRSHSPSVSRMRESPTILRRALQASRIAGIRKPRTEPLQLGTDQSMPRQFEYSQLTPEWMVVGTTMGEVAVMNHRTNKLVTSIKSGGNIVLGLCWLKKERNKFLAGSENGCIELFDVEKMKEGVKGWKPYEPFPHLTCVHANSQDQYLLTSGYSGSIKLYDLPTGRTLETLADIHSQHINVLKFANHNPNLFVTSSFDKKVKMWDLRQKRAALWERENNAGCVMCCFSPDDRYVLSAAVDNEVRQFNMDGTQVLHYELKQLQSNTNYTRAYFMNGSDYIIVGSCEESAVRVCETNTGKILLDVEFAGGRYGPTNTLSTPYIQSLRADPFADFQCSCVLGYNAAYYSAQLVRVNLLQEESAAG